MVINCPSPPPESSQDEYFEPGALSLCIRPDLVLRCSLRRQAEGPGSLVSTRAHGKCIKASRRRVASSSSWELVARGGLKLPPIAAAIQPANLNAQEGARRLISAHSSSSTARDQHRRGSGELTKRLSAARRFPCSLPDEARPRHLCLPQPPLRRRSLAPAAATRRRRVPHLGTRKRVAEEM